MDNLAIEPALVSRVDCPCCGSTSPRMLVSHRYDAPLLSDYLERFYNGRLDTGPLRNRTYELASCSVCGLVYQTQVPNATYLQHLYETVALDDPNTVSISRGLAVRQAYAADIERLIEYQPRSHQQVSVLDHGSGTGLWLQMAAAFGCTTAGTELSRSALDRLEAAGHEAFDPDGLPRSSFDFINSEQVVEHLVDPSTALEQLVRALRPGGLMRISVPNGSNIAALLAIGDWGAPKGSRRSLTAVAPLEHLNCFDPVSLRRLATDAGLECFRFPLRQCVRPSSRIRTAAGAVRARIRPTVGTLQWFRKPC